MRVFIRTPFSIERNIGVVYNEEMSMIPDGQAACFIDGDCMFLTPDYGNILHEYANKYNNAVLTCYTNRIHELAKGQLHPTMRSTDMLECMKFADSIKHDRTATPIQGSVSGFLMVVPKHIWQDHGFTEVNVYKPGLPNLLGCDNFFINSVRSKGIEVLRMNGLFCYHGYRLLTGNKNHLL